MDPARTGGYQKHLGHHWAQQARLGVAQKITAITLKSCSTELLQALGKHAMQTSLPATRWHVGCRRPLQPAKPKGVRRCSRIRASAGQGSGLVAAGPSDSPPDYTAIDSQSLNRAVYGLFRKRMAAQLGGDSRLEGYGAIIDMTRRLNSSFGSPRETQEATRRILKSLFPPWLPPAFKVMFSRPFPQFSCQLNAWATWLTCQWLMGPCEVNDVEVDGGRIGVGQGVLVKRCRYLEEAGCASICINSCKIPTQEFFEKDMGLPLTMKPNYEDFSCQFSFGRTPEPQGADEALSTPCFAQCPTARRASRCHNIVPQ